MAVELLPHEAFGLFTTLSGTLTVSRRNVPNVFAHIPQFTILRSNKERALYDSTVMVFCTGVVLGSPNEWGELHVFPEYIRWGTCDSPVLSRTSPLVWHRHVSEL